MDTIDIESKLTKTADTEAKMCSDGTNTEADVVTEADAVENRGLYDQVSFCGQTLAALYLTDPKDLDFDELQSALAALHSLDDWPLGEQAELREAHTLIAAGACEAKTTLAKEYQRLFIGPHHFNAPAWGSVYLDKDQVLFGASLLELRQWMRKYGIASNEDKREPEDHIGKMLALMAWLASEKPELLGEFLSAHLMTWAPRYLELFTKDAQGSFYRGLGILTKTTLDAAMAVLDIRPVKRRIYF